MLKYKIREDLEPYFYEDIVLYRIEALIDIPSYGIKKGDLGGWIESEENLSQEGSCWISDDAMVYENAKVYENARVYNNAMVYGDARVYGNAKVYENTEVYDNAEVFDDAIIYGNSLVFGNAKVCGDAEVNYNDILYGDILINKNIRG